MGSTATRHGTWAVAAAVVFVLCGLGMLGLTGLPADLAFVGARLLGAAALVCAALFVVARGPIARGINRLLASFSRVGSDLAASVRTGWRQDGRAHWLALIAIILVGIGLRLSFLGQPMRHDESVTYLRFASEPLYEGLSDYAAPGNHLFNTAQVHVSMALFGSSPAAIRLPAFLAGVLLVPATYACLRALYGKHVALLAAGLAASSSALIEFSTNARGYSFLALDFVLMLWVAAYVQRTGEPAGWLVLAVLGALGFYTLPLAVFPVGIVIVWLALSAAVGLPGLSRGAVLRGLVVCCALIALLTLVAYAGVLVTSGWRAVVSNRVVSPKTWEVFAQKSPRTLQAMWLQWNRDIPAALRVLLLAGVAACVVLHKRLATHRVPLIVPLLAVCLALIVLRRMTPKPRYLLFVVPLYVGLASAGLIGLLRLLERRLGRLASPAYLLAAVVACVGLGANVLRTQSVYYSVDTGSFRDAEAVVAFLKECSGDDDRVLTRFPADPCLGYYARRLGVPRSRFVRGRPQGSRFIAVVNTSRGQTLDMVLERNKLSLSAFAPPQQIRRFETAVVYRLTRLDPGREETGSVAPHGGER